MIHNNMMHEYLYQFESPSLLRWCKAHNIWHTYGIGSSIWHTSERRLYFSHVSGCPLL